ncbi:cbb3-type cytochrome c oxidase subunit I [Christiangramia forsetii]|uniref:Cbb3-type cytochrome c oxidase subunit I n=2 Tax=Christiangramia forsetii TaxID=411153 RepID=A0M177_CHRFK|nr:cbb3-type cytochrome c oxidase subunit I [Christiangramia forsetii]GGG43158.1 cytochrome oxidase subunit I [Christiangramia forsetii]CAL66372.1 cbb3-type cytochrome c oxidase subunit I [Christiangramia forsetii KT0803]
MKIFHLLTLIFTLVQPDTIYAQVKNVSTESWITSPGILGTIVLITIVLVVAIIIFLSRINSYVDSLKKKQMAKTRLAFDDELVAMESDEIDTILEKRKAALHYKLKGNELSGENEVFDKKGLIQKITNDPNNAYFDEKKKTSLSLETPEPLKKIVIYYIGAAIVWLVLGTLIGQYLGMKFIWPEMDNQSWLSFGRLRPVHTNMVFWGWSSLAMIGLGYFVIARTSNTIIHSYKWAWRAWVFINSSVILGSIFLMAGINNGGGEYREYIWPVMLLFAIALVITFFNFYKTVANRKISEIYISNWFILASLIWTIVLAVIGYLPFYQDGLGETVIQGYYMHQGVGMWFMTFTLGLVYYYLPSALNKPIYSYSLGVLAFWTQMLFYTMIGTHHFVFSPLPWWLQTTAIVFSAGMFIPVVAGTTNFLMTMKGSWSHISKSYVLPFFLVGTLFYFVGSTQGSFQAFRFTNYVWHFTDFNVAHSHMTMYGIIAFFLWAAIYAILPKLTGKEPPQVLVGAHFWMAFIGLFAYMVSLMVGGTYKGLSWIEGNAFIESVILMKPYWVWRAIGGSLMFTSHLIFAYNFYYIVKNRKKVLISEATKPVEEITV